LLHGQAKVPLAPSAASQLGAGEDGDAGVVEHLVHGGRQPAGTALPLGVQLRVAVGPPTQAVLALHQRYLAAAVGQGQGRCEPSGAAPHHRHRRASRQRASRQRLLLAHPGHRRGYQGARLFGGPCPIAAHPGTLLPQVGDPREVGIDAGLGQRRLELRSVFLRSTGSEYHALPAPPGRVRGQRCQAVRRTQDLADLSDVYTGQAGGATAHRLQVEGFDERAGAGTQNHADTSLGGARANGTRRGTPPGEELKINCGLSSTENAPDWRVGAAKTLAFSTNSMDYKENFSPGSSKTLHAPIKNASSRTLVLIESLPSNDVLPKCDDSLR